MNISIWGAGKFGQYVGKQLNEIYNIVCYIDNQPGDKDDVLGKKVVSPEEYSNTYKNQTDVVLVAVVDWYPVYEQVCQMEIESYGVIDGWVLRHQLALANDIVQDTHIFWRKDFESKKTFVKKLETNVVDYCNLNCKGCSHFSNIFNKGETAGFDLFEKDIRYLADKLLIGHFDLLGGEPFLSEELWKYIKCLRDNMPKTSITIVSNGILIPKQSAKLFSYIKKNDILISLTAYPPTIKLKSKIVDMLEKFGILYEFRESVQTFGKNIDLSGKNNPYVAQTKCRESWCRFLRNGKIYKCPFSALGSYFFDKYDIPLHFEEGIDIYDEENDLRQALQKLSTEPVEQCKYCGEEERFSWEISNTPECGEWIIGESITGGAE